MLRLMCCPLSYSGCGFIHTYSFSEYEIRSSKNSAILFLVYRNSSYEVSIPNGFDLATSNLYRWDHPECSRQYCSSCDDSLYAVLHCNFPVVILPVTTYLCVGIWPTRLPVALLIIYSPDLLGLLILRYQLHLSRVLFSLMQRFPSLFSNDR